MHESEGEGNESGDVQMTKTLKKGLSHMVRMCRELGNVIISALSSTV